MVGRVSQSMEVFGPVDEDIGDHRDPQLRLDGIGRCSKEGFDMQVLLDPLEEQLHFPSLAILSSAIVAASRVSWLVRKISRFAGLGIDVANPPQRVRVQ